MELLFCESREVVIKGYWGVISNFCYRLFFLFMRMYFFYYIEGYVYFFRREIFLNIYSFIIVSLSLRYLGEYVVIFIIINLFFCCLVNYKLKMLFVLIYLL